MNMLRAARRPLALPLAALLATALALAACGGETTSTSGSPTPTPDPIPTATTTATGGPPTIDGVTGGTAGSTGFVAKTYSNCTWLTTGGSMVGGGSGSSGLTLAVDGASVIATFHDDGQPNATLALTATSASSATLSTPGQGFPGTWGYCGGGVTSTGAIADPGPAPATLSLSSAVITVDDGVAFLSMTGLVTDVASTDFCPADSRSGALTAQLVCGTASAAGGATAGTGSGASFAPGTYDCTSESLTVNTSGGVDDTAGASSSGTLTLAKSAAGLTATYSGDAFASGALDFTPTSDSTANPVAGQSFAMACGVFSATTPLDPATATVVTQVNAGALTTDGTTLFLSFLGNAASGPCSPQTASEALECTLQP